MVVSICGFNCSGSSAVIHLLKEYDETKIIDFECMILDLPDGIRDLDFCMHAGGGYFREDRAMLRFQKMIHNHRYIQKYSGKKADAITEQYLNKLTAVQWQGRSVYDYIYCDTIEKYLWYFKRLIEKAIYSRTKKRTGFTNRQMRVKISDQDFYALTREYMDNLIHAFDGDLEKVTVMDQLMPPVNTKEYLKYINNAKAVIVDRDPRDMYLNLHLGVDCNCVPLTAKEFVEYHKQWWESKEMCRNSKELLYIQFEDLIYHYEETVPRIEDFLGLKKHPRKRKIFRPERSINNTQIFRRTRGFEDDIIYIEQELKEYLYPYPEESIEKMSREYKYVQQKGR